VFGRIDPLLCGIREHALAFPPGLFQKQLLSLPIDIPVVVLRHHHKQLSGEHTWMATPVPIPNTAVKHPGPMVVREARE
jgi:hypothetical protein